MDVNRVLGGFFKDGKVPDAALSRVLDFSYEVGKIKEHLKELKAERDAIKSENESSLATARKRLEILEKAAQDNKQTTERLLQEAKVTWEDAQKHLDESNRQFGTLEARRKEFQDLSAKEMASLLERNKDLEIRISKADWKEDAQKVRDEELARATREQLKAQAEINRKESELMKQCSLLAERDIVLIDKQNKLAEKEKELLKKIDEVIALRAAQEGVEVDLRNRESALAKEKQQLKLDRQQLTQDTLTHKSNVNSIRERQLKLKNDEDRLLTEIAKVNDMKRALLKEAEK